MSKPERPAEPVANEQARDSDVVKRFQLIQCKYGDTLKAAHEKSVRKALEAQRLLHDTLANHQRAYAKTAMDLVAEHNAACTERDHATTRRVYQTQQDAWVALGKQLNEASESFWAQIREAEKHGQEAAKRAYAGYLDDLRKTFGAEPNIKSFELALVAQRVLATACHAAALGAS